MGVLMKERLLKFLICPKCKGDFALYKITTKTKGEVKEGIIKCKKCKKNYPIKNYIPRFVENDKYVGNFSYEWHKHKTTQLDSKLNNNETEETFRIKTGFNLKELNSKLIMDVGCGTGRFMEVALKYDAEIIGIDLSFAVDVAQNNVGFNRNAHVIQADIFNLPFKKEIFNYIFSIGVLHHTPNTKKAFMNLIPFLKKHGKIAIWVYTNEGSYMKIYNKTSEFWRFFTIRIPPKKLYQLGRFWSNSTYSLKKVRILRLILQVVLPPTSIHQNRDWRALDTFDWLSAKYQWKHTYSEVEDWFKEADLMEIKRLEASVSVTGKKM